MPDPRRVITKPFLPTGHSLAEKRPRVQLIVDRILAMPDDEVAATLAATSVLFAGRHRRLEDIFERSFALVGDRVPGLSELTTQRRQLVGAYFTHEFSIEAAALGNPSIVAAPDQSGLPAGALRFILSLRAIGEGHLSSVEFRTGVIDASANVTIDEPGPHPSAGTRSRTAPTYAKRRFRAKLIELGAYNEVARLVVDPLPEQFTLEQLDRAIDGLDDEQVPPSIAFETIRIVHWLASSNYEVSYDAESDVSERVIFPAAPTESRGIEDARFVRFTHDDASVVYYATYTAFDGFEILPQLIETSDFVSFRIATLHGPGAQNKGIAFFPRLINGRYTALARHDNENNFLMRSDDAHFWYEADRIQEPTRPWELIQIGNCGSPLETKDGWLVITHGVGPMRRYTLGALLLDLDDPCRVIGHLDEPFLLPGDAEREGYVPNVVYSCGALIHGDTVVLPYGFSDMGARIATVPLADLLGALGSPAASSPPVPGGQTRSR